MILGDGVTALAYTDDNGAWALNVHADGRTVPDSGDYGPRPCYRWSIHVNGALLAADNDIHGGVGMPHNARDGMGTLLAFLGNDADRYRRHMGPVPDGEDDYSFGETVAEWAYGVEDELAMAAVEIEPTEQQAASHTIDD